MRLPRLSPARAVLLSGVFPLVVRLLLLPMIPVPNPEVADEFSYLLGGDTFAHGRLTNPPHPLWTFFEAYHILVQPTYASMYPPGQALFLALGQVVSGRAWWGVFLSVGLMCGAVCWLLQGFLPPRWSLPGSLSFALLFGIEHYFMNSYWGGAVAAAGGALLLGAAGRLLFPGRRPRRDALNGFLAGLGAAILLHTRVWEGLCLGLPVAVALLAWSFRVPRPERRARLLRVALPAALPIVAAVAFLLRLDKAVTGDAFEMPYLLNRRTYHVAPLFLWQDEKPPHEYRHEMMRLFYGDWKVSEKSSRGGAPTKNPLVGLGIWIFRYKLLGGTLVAAILAGIFVRATRVRFLLVVLGVFFAGISLQSYRLMHYLAPGMGLCVAVLLLGYRTLGALRWVRHRFGRILPLIVLASAAVGFTRNTVQTVLYKGHGYGPRRAELVAKLDAMPGNHLVVVRYGPSFHIHEEWAYNGADIDGGRIVFACDMGPEENRKLTSYYHDRRIWLFAPDEGDSLVPLVSPSP